MTKFGPFLGGPCIGHIWPLYGSRGGIYGPRGTIYSRNPPSAGRQCSSFEPKRSDLTPPNSRHGVVSINSLNLAFHECFCNLLVTMFSILVRLGSDWAPFWFHLGSQNGSQIQQKSKKKQSKNLIGKLTPFEGNFSSIFNGFGTQLNLKKYQKRYEGCHFLCFR